MEILCGGSGIYRATPFISYRFCAMASCKYFGQLNKIYTDKTDIEIDIESENIYWIVSLLQIQVGSHSNNSCLSDFHPILENSLLRETLNLLACADSSTNTKRLKMVGNNENG